MGKFDAPHRIPQKEIDELFIDFAKALASVRNALEAANLIKDLLTEQEVAILPAICKFPDCWSRVIYKQIHRYMRVGNSTVAKVHA